MVFLLMGLFCTALSTVTTRADFGNFSGDTDFGGGGGGGGWDSDSSSGGSLVGEIGTFFLAVVLVIILIIFFAIKELFSKLFKKKDNNVPGGAAPPMAQRGGGGAPALQPMRAYLSLDPGFNEGAFRERLSNLYVQMQQRWHEKNIESLKPYFTDAFYEQSDRQLDEMRRYGRTPCTERVAVLEVSPKGFYQTGGMDHIVVTVRSRIVAYILEDKTGRVVSGDMRREKFMTYEWDLCRKSGTVTGTSDGIKSISCPHCGAPLNINQTAKCPFCDSVVTVVNEDWALNNIKGIAQQTR